MTRAQNLAYSASLQTELGLSLAMDARALKFSQLCTSEQLQALLALQQQAEPRADHKALGSYLIGRLAWDLGAVMAFVDLQQLNVDSLQPDRLGWQVSLESQEHEQELHQWLCFRFQLSPEGLYTSGQLPWEQVSLALFAPLVQALKPLCGLSAPPLWALVADGLSAAYLYLGRELNRADEAMSLINQRMRQAKAPLDNKRWHFQHVQVSPEQSPTGEALGQWFRMRGGCCRYYTLADGQYCTSCVHLSDEQRQQRFQDYLCRTAVPQT